MDFVLLLISDIVLGFFPQAVGCAIFVFAIADQKIRSKSFVYTAVIYCLIAMVIRIMYDVGLIDFGFHTIIIWMMFIIIAIAYNKISAFQATISILMSGIIITLSEIVTVGCILAIAGEEKFNQIMNHGGTVADKVTKAFYGVPANLLFLAIVIVVSAIIKRRRKKLPKADKEI